MGSGRKPLASGPERPPERMWPTKGQGETKDACVSALAPSPPSRASALQPPAPPGKAHPLVGQRAQTTGCPSVVFPTTHCWHAAVFRLVIWTHKGLVWESTPPCWLWLGGVLAGEARVGGCGVSARKQPQAQDWWKEISIPWRTEVMMWGSPLRAWLPLLGSCHLPSPSLLEGTSTDTTLHCQGLRDLPESSSHWTSGKVCWQLCPPSSQPPATCTRCLPLTLSSYGPQPQALASHMPSESLCMLV